MKPQADISVIICTRNRAESLRKTLQCLVAADKGPLHCEVVIIDNGSSDDTAEVAREFSNQISLHYLVELQPGKGHALNCALNRTSLGKIVAVLDDDMSPHRDWFLGVMKLCERWPEKDFFTGRSYAIWPVEDVPAWCLRPGLMGWAYSVMGGTTDKLVDAGRWFSGNHFWFRSRVLAGGRFFEVGKTDLTTHIEMSEPQFMLQLAEEGYGGVSGPDAVCGHRIQPELLSLELLKRRAMRVGRGFAVARLSPFRQKLKQARLFKEHPVIARLYCLASLVGWGSVFLLTRLGFPRPAMIELRLQSIQRFATYREYLRIAGQMSEYRVFRLQPKRPIFVRP